MTADNIGALASKVFDLVSKIDSSDQKKVFTAVFALCGLEQLDLPPSKEQAPAPDPAAKKGEGSGAVGSAGQYFEEKAPISKMEKIAVAARYLELSTGAMEHTKKQMADVFSEARRNFDSGNYAADLRNAKNIGLFVKGDNAKLSFGGQNYVDALPDRTAAEAKLRKPVKKGGRKPASKAAK